VHLNQKSKFRWLVTNDVTSGTSQSFMFLHVHAFCFLDDRIVSSTSVCLFLLKRQWTEPAVFGKSWLDVTTHSQTQTLFCTDSPSTWLGVAEDGTLKLDLRSLKCQNPSFFLEYLFYILQTEIPNKQNPEELWWKWYLKFSQNYMTEPFLSHNLIKLYDLENYKGRCSFSSKSILFQRMYVEIYFSSLVHST